MTASTVNALPEFNTKEIPELAKDDEEKFVVDFQRVTVSAEARRILTGGEPVDD
jgi:hypothetical protein